MYTNADSLINKRAELKGRISIQNPDIICINETLPKNCLYDVSEGDLIMEGYTAHIPNNMKRGTIIYTANHLIASKIEFNSSFEEYIFCTIKVSNNKSYTLGCVYRSPNSSSSNNEELLNLLQEVYNSKWDILNITGDFNYREINWETREISVEDKNHPCNKMYDKINDLFLIENIKQPTRFRHGERPSNLDWVLSDNPDRISNICIDTPLGASDHSVITFTLDTDFEILEEKPRYLYFKGNYTEMRSELEEKVWLEDTSWVDFENFMTGLIERHIPKKKFLSKKTPPWMNRETRNQIKLKHKAWNRYHKTRTKENWDSYTIVRNETDRVIKSAKSNFENKLSNEIKGNPKAFWSYVKNKAATKSGIGDLVDNDNNVVTNEDDKANVLNKYFGSVFTEEDLSSIPEPDNLSFDTPLTKIEINEDNILKHLTKLNTSKSAGPDGIHSKVLFETRHQIITPLCIIYKNSANNGILPQEWKMANVIPIYKKGSKKQPCNYRPVSLTAICCKILERIIRNEIVKHLELNNLLSRDQHGFREGRSCLTQLLEVMEIWSSLYDKGLAWDTVYLDFAKAFDRVPHQRLIAKIKAMGIEGSLLNWIKDFLSDRRQRVLLGHSKSNWVPVTSGIPQGSVLGPILFVIFINDLPNSISSYIKIFADDTKIFRALRSAGDISTLQEDVNKMLEWSIKWQLPFNIPKCKIIHYGKNNPNHIYSMDSRNMTEDTSEKDLGVTFDSELSFRTHIKNTVAKANSRVGLIKRTFSYMNITNFKLLYKSLVRPILEYCSSIWSPHYQHDIDEVEKVQRRATKIIPELMNLPYQDRLKAVKLPTLEYRRIRSDIIQVFRIMKGYDQIDPSKLFTLSSSSSNRGHNLKIYKPRCESTLKLHSFSCRTINLWNNLPQDVVDSQSINSFKTGLEKHWNNCSLIYDPQGEIH